MVSPLWLARLPEREQLVTVERGVFGGVMQDVSNVFRPRIESVALPRIVDPVEKLLGDADVDLHKSVIAPAR